MHMDDPEKEKFNVTERIFDTLGMDYDLATHIITLCGELQCVESGGLERYGGRGHIVQVFPTIAESGIAQAEGM